MLTVDLNSDIGESFGNYRIDQNEKLLDIISSANLACGMHAGDPMIMNETVRKAAERGIGIGAHPGYPDLQGFGRRYMAMSYQELYNFVLYQLGALSAFTKVYGVKIQHLNPHGALGTFAQKDEEAARAVVKAAYDFDPSLILPVHNEKSWLNRVAREYGMRTVTRKFFTDRAYTDDGFLVPRGTPGAMIEDEDYAIERVIRLIKENKLITITGKEIHMESPQMIMMHGDQPKAVLFASRMKDALSREGIAIRNFADSL